jgi:hypothetical protein
MKTRVFGISIESPSGLCLSESHSGSDLSGSQVAASDRTSSSSGALLCNCPLSIVAVKSEMFVRSVGMSQSTVGVSRCRDLWIYDRVASGKVAEQAMIGMPGNLAISKPIFL